MKKEKFTPQKGEEIIFIHIDNKMKLKNKIFLTLVFIAILISLLITMFSIIFLQLFEVITRIFSVIFCFLGEFCLIIIICGVFLINRNSYYYFTSTRIIEKHRRKTNQILLKDIGNVIAWTGTYINIVTRNEKGEPYIKLDESFSDKDKNIHDILYWDFKSISVIAEDAVKPKIIAYLKERLTIIKYNKFEESRELALKETEENEGLTEVYNDFFDSIKEIFVVT